MEFVILEVIRSTFEETIIAKSKKGIKFEIKRFADTTTKTGFSDSIYIEAIDSNFDFCKKYPSHFSLIEVIDSVSNLESFDNL